MVRRNPSGSVKRPELIPKQTTHTRIQFNLVVSFYLYLHTRRLSHLYVFFSVFIFFFREINIFGHANGSRHWPYITCFNLGLVLCFTLRSSAVEKYNPLTHTHIHTYINAYTYISTTLSFYPPEYKKKEKRKILKNIRDISKKLTLIISFPAFSR